MKKAILLGIIGFALASVGFATTAFAYDYYDPCVYYGCTDPMAGIWNQNYNDNFSWNETINTNINDISIGGGFGGDYNGGGSYDYPQCDDGRDNDGDGDYDYPEDRGCSSYGDDSERSSSDNTDYECNDGRDNDHDGDYDYPEDRGCSSRNDNSEDSDDNDRNQCDDNRDNDGDGDIDYPEDRGCSSRTDDSENSDRDTRYECDDNRDNDGDGDEDYPEDRGCSSRTDDSEDSDDNDNDKPEVTTRDASSINETSATLNGRVDGNGSNTRAWFEYSDNRSDISSDEETDEDSVGSGTTTFSDRITGLRRNTTYYFRAVARNGDGEDRGSILSFRTDDSNSDNEPECDDNRDNDRDGDEDYPEDRGCSSRNDDSEDSDGRDDDDRNLPPFYTSTPSTSVIAGQLYSYNADALSPNGRSITYNLTTRPSGMTINEYTGQVLWQTTLGQTGTSHVVRVVAEDSNGNTATQTFTILVRSQIINPPVFPPVNPPVNPPVQQLNITGLRTDEVGGDVIVSFNTNIGARGSVRYGTVSEMEKDEDFTYPFGQISKSGLGTSHEVNLGPLAPNQIYYIRAFATAGSRSDMSQEFAFTRQEAEVVATEEIFGTASCSDGVDNDRDGVADAADSDCDEQVSGQVNGTFASALESFGAFLISPWFLILVIIVLIIYIVLTRHEHEVVDVHAPIEIKS